MAQLVLGARCAKTGLVAEMVDVFEIGFEIEFVEQAARALDATKEREAKEREAKEREAAKERNWARRPWSD